MRSSVGAPEGGFAAFLADVLGARALRGCTPAYTCSGDCQDPTLACSLLQDTPLGLDFTGPGLCFEAGSVTPELDCGAGGADGTGQGGAAGAGGAR